MNKHPALCVLEHFSRPSASTSLNFSVHLVRSLPYAGYIAQCIQHYTVCRSLSMRFWVDDGCMRLTRGSGNVTLLHIFISASARFSLIHIVGELWDWWNWSGNPKHIHRMISLNLVINLCMEEGLLIWTARRLLWKKTMKIMSKVKILNECRRLKGKMIMLGQFCGWQILSSIPLFKLGFVRMNILRKIRRSSLEYIIFSL